MSVLCLGHGVLAILVEHLDCELGYGGFCHVDVQVWLVQCERGVRVVRFILISDFPRL